MSHDKELIERMVLEKNDKKLIDLLADEAIDDWKSQDGWRYADFDAALRWMFKRGIARYLAERGKEAVAWMSPGKERLEFSRPDTVYGSYTLPLFLGPQVFELDAEYERGKSDGWEACETCHGIVDGVLPTKPAGDTDFDPKTCPEAYLQQEIAKLCKQPAIPEGMALVGYVAPETIINLRNGTRYGGARISPRVDEGDGLTEPIFAAAGVKPCQKPSKLQEEINAVAASIHAKVKP